VLFSPIPDSENLQEHHATRLETGYSDGDTVDPWKNQSGSTDATVDSGSPTFRENQINGQPAIEFDSNSWYDSGHSQDTSNPRSIYIVAYLTPSASNPNQNNSLWGANDAGANASSEITADVTNNNYLHHWADSEATVGTVTTGSYIIVSQVDLGSGGSISNLYQNSNNENTLNYNNTNNVRINDYIGVRNDGGNRRNALDGYIAEIMRYNTAHSSSTRQDVWGYLNSSYSIF
jgi:hypothetical protein